MQLKNYVGATTGIFLDSMGRILSERVELQALNNGNGAVKFCFRKRKKICTKINISEWEQMDIINLTYISQSVVFMTLLSSNLFMI